MRLTKLVGIISAGMVVVGCGVSEPMQLSVAVGHEDTSNSITDNVAEKELVDTSLDEREDLPSWKRNNEEPITLEWFVSSDWGTHHDFRPIENTFDRYLLEETGITIKWKSGNTDQLNLLIATNNLPDIVTCNINQPERKMMENKEMLYALDDLMGQYAPDFNVPESMIEWYTNEQDGNWYAFASYFYAPERMGEDGGYIVSHNMNYARVDIMEALEIDPSSMTTKDGFIAALEKVKEAEYQYNGKNVEPYVSLDPDGLAEQFGVDREDKEGNLINIMRQPEYEEAFLFLNEIYTKGLMPDAVFTMDNTMLKQKYVDGEVFAGTNANNTIGREELYYKDPNALMMSIGFIEGDSGKEPYITPSPTGGWTGTMISRNCTYPERAIQLFSFLSQEEQVLMHEFGGVGGQEFRDGKVYMTDERKEEQKANHIAYDMRYNCSGVGYFLDYTIKQKYEPAPASDDLFRVDEQRQIEAYFNGSTYDDKVFSNVRPEGGSELAAIERRVDEYLGQMIPQIIMSDTQEEASALYHQMIAQADVMGMKELDAYKNECFKKNKEKLGLEFAWPRNH